MVIQITYGCHKDNAERRGEAIADLAERIFGSPYCLSGQQIFDGVWMVETSASVPNWTEIVLMALPRGDSIVVAPVHGYVGGILPKTLWAWINEHVR